MFPPSSASAPLPPLPNLQSASGTGGSPGQSDALASIMAGVAPIKSGVDAIVTACKQIVQSGAVPGAEQVCGQIIALASSLLPMAVQQANNPMGGGLPPSVGGQ